MLSNSFKNGAILTVGNCQSLYQIDMGRESWTETRDQGIEGAKMTLNCMTDCDR